MPMSDYRYQPFTDQWVLVAGNRQERPNEFVPSSQRVEQQVCPFCRGNESETPETLAAYPAYPNSQDWDVRVFPNKYPALRPVPSQSMQHRGPYVQRDGFGIHELIVLSSRHVESLSELSQDECRLSMIAFQDRLRAAYAEPETQHAVLFQNCRH